MHKISALCLGACLASAAPAVPNAHGNGQFKSALSGYSETPIVLTTGTGKITVAVSSDKTSLDITLTFSKLVGVAQSASLFLGGPGSTGGAIAPICGGTKPACPTAADGTVTVTLSASDIAAVPAQGLAAGDLASVITALTHGAIYANVITTKFPNGEIRGQVERGFSFGAMQ